MVKKKKPLVYRTGDAHFDAHPYRLAIAAPVRVGRARAGVSADTLDLYDNVDSEFLKRGTLSHSSVKWDWIEEQSVTLLRENTKDLRVLIFLVTALLNARNAHGLTLSLCMAIDFTENYFTSCFPRRVSMRKALLQKIVHIICHETDAIAGIIAGEGSTSRAIILSALERLQKISAARNLDIAAIKALVERIEAKSSDDIRDTVPANSNDAAGANASVTVHGGDGSGTPQDHATASPNALLDAVARQLPFDIHDGRAVRKAVSSVADFMFAQDPSNPVSYELRRHATWIDITVPPPIKDGERTILQAPAPDSTILYRAGVEAGNVDNTVLLKLERFCLNQPFWLEGQYLVYCTLVHRGWAQSAACVQSSTRRFLERLPAIRPLLFSNGDHFVTADVRDWLAQSAVATEANGGPVASLQSDLVLEALIENAGRMLSAGQLSEALNLIEANMQSVQSLRQQTYWEIAFLSLLRDHGLHSYANRQSELLDKRICDVSLSEWEPQIFSAIAALRQKPHGNAKPSSGKNAARKKSHPRRAASATSSPDGHPPQT